MPADTKRRRNPDEGVGATDDGHDPTPALRPRPPHLPAQEPISAPIPPHGNGAPAQPSQPTFVVDPPPPGRPGTPHKTIEWRIRIVAVVFGLIVLGLAAYSTTLVTKPDNAPANAAAGTVVPLQVVEVRVVQGGDAGTSPTAPPRIEAALRNPSSVPQRTRGLRMTVTDWAVTGQCGVARPELPAEPGDVVLTRRIGDSGQSQPSSMPGDSDGVVAAEVSISDPVPNAASWLRLDVEVLDSGGGVLQRAPVLVAIPRPFVSSIFDPAPDGSTTCAKANADAVLRLAAGPPVMSPQAKVTVRGASVTAKRR